MNMLGGKLGTQMEKIRKKIIAGETDAKLEEIKLQHEVTQRRIEIIEDDLASVVKRVKEHFGATGTGASLDPQTPGNQEEPNEAIQNRTPVGAKDVYPRNPRGLLSVGSSSPRRIQSRVAPPPTRAMVG